MQNARLAAGVFFVPGLGPKGQGPFAAVFVELFGPIALPVLALIVLSITVASWRTALRSLRAAAQGRPSASVIATAHDIEESLFQSAITGDIKGVERLLANGADVNVRGNMEQTPLHRAVDYNQKKMVELLIAHHADVNARTQYGGTPLSSAVWRNHKEIAELLIAHHADLKEASILAMAVKRGRREMAELLIAHHADVDAKEEKGWTPLHYAVDAKRKEMAELLIAHHADVNATNNEGLTPLQFAEKLGRKDIAALLRCALTDSRTGNTKQEKLF